MGSEEMAPEDGAETKLSGVFATITKGISVLSLALVAAGFLAARAAITGLGLPSHVEVPFDAYVQHGGRFLFALAGHALIVAWVLTTFYMTLGALKARIHLVHRVYNSMLASALLLLAVSTFTLSLQLNLLGSASTVGDAPLETKNDIPVMGLIAAVTLTAASVAWIARLLRKLGAGPGEVSRYRPLLALSAVLVILQAILLPVCYGRVLLIPHDFPEVSVVLAAELSDAFQARLVYRDSHDYYFLQGKNLVQIRRAAVKEIHYGSPVPERTVTPNQ